jgi:hypothetical protein
MAEDVMIIALKQCYVVMSQYAVNELVMFLSTLILFIIVIFLAIYISKIKRDFSIKEDNYIKQILRLSEKNDNGRPTEKDPGKSRKAA